VHDVIRKRIACVQCSQKRAGDSPTEETCGWTSIAISRLRGPNGVRAQGSARSSGFASRTTKPPGINCDGPIVIKHQR
jgi:hypothetical protein